MKCPVCSFDNQPPGRYCQRCGAPMPSPPPAAPAASAPRTGAPAYLTGPSRSGLVIALIAIVLGLGVVLSVGAWWMMRDSFGSFGMTASPANEPPAAVQAPAPQPPASIDVASAKEEIPAAAPSPPSPAESTPPLPPLAPSASPEAAAPAPVSATPPEPQRAVPAASAPSTEAPRRAAKPASKPRTNTAKVEPNVQPAAPPSPSPAPRYEPPAKIAAAPPAVAREPRRDHWQQMQDEIDRCRNENFFGRVICEQRVRLRYCDGYWGKAEQCPSGRQADYGQ